MKKSILALALLGLTAGAVSADDLLDNPYYARSIQLESMARSAFDEGDYDAATEYAAEALDYARQSDRYVALMVDKRRAETAMAAAGERLDWAVGSNAEKRFPEAWAAANAEMQASRDAYAAEAYAEARTRAEYVLVELEAVHDRPIFPAFYVVREFPVRTDCLWRIAALPFVYNDPLRWPELWAANKAIIPNPANPNLIKPGAILAIPAIAGELREGTWIEGEEYPIMGVSE